MSVPPSSDHFKGKTVVEHLQEARQKGAMASAEIHGTEMPGSLAAGADAARETGIVLLLITLIFSLNHSAAPFVSSFLFLFCIGWFFWKTGRSALLCWARLERLHRLIEEERWEIAHNRSQEKEELTDLYQAKGLQGKLLKEVVDVLMADDNRCLRVMLEEELGLKLGAYEHPLKQACGAALGVAATSLFGFMGWFFAGYLGLYLSQSLIVIAATWLACSVEKNRVLSTLIWIGALIALIVGMIYGFSLKFSS